MKKQALVFVLLITTVCASAFQISPFPLSPDSMQSNLVAYRVNVYGTTGSFDEHAIYQKTNDTAWMAGPIVSTTDTSRWYRLTNLDSLTTYRMKIIVSNKGISDTTYALTFTTKAPPLPAPAPQPILITNIQVYAALLQTIVRFHYQAIGDTFEARGYYGNYQNSSHTIKGLTGTGDTSVIFNNPNVPGTLYSSNAINVHPVGNVSPGVIDTFFAFSDYTVPLETSANISSVTLTTTSPGSANATASIAVGNTGSAIVTPKIVDSAQHVTKVLPSITFTHDTILNWQITGLKNFTLYAFRAITYDATGFDSAQTQFVRTFQDSAGTIVSWDTLNATKNSVKLKIKFNSNGTYTGNTGIAWIDYIDADGNIQTTDTAKNLLGNVTDTFSLSNLKPGPQQNGGIIYFQNAAGITTTLPISFGIKGIIPGFVIPFTWQLMTGAYPSSTLVMTNIEINPSLGDDDATLLGVKRLTGQTIGDTTILLAHIKGLMIINDSIVNCLGGEGIYEQLLGRSKDNDIQGNGLEQFQVTAAPFNPAMEDVIIDSIIHGPTSEVISNIRANGNGTLTVLRIQLFKDGSQIGDDDTINAGTSYVDYKLSFANLLDGNYSIKLSAVGFSENVVAPFVKSFTIGTATGFSQVSKPTEDPNEVVKIVDVLGQTLVSGIRRSEVLSWKRTTNNNLISVTFTIPLK